jgi:hypothetical protein
MGNLLQGAPNSYNSSHILLTNFKTNEAARQFRGKGFDHYESMAMILPQTFKGNNAFQPSRQTFGAVSNTAADMQPPSSHLQQQHMPPLPGPAHVQQQHMLPLPEPADLQQQHMSPLPGPSHVQQEHMPPQHIHSDMQQWLPFDDAQQDFFKHELQHMQLQNAYGNTQQQLPFDDALQEHMPPQNIHSNGQQQLPFGDLQQQQHMPPQNIHNNMQQDFFSQLQQQHMQPQDVCSTQHWSFQQQQRQGLSIVGDTNSIAPHPPSTPLHPPTSVITSASHSTAPALSATSSRSSLKCKQSAYRDGTSGASSEKRRKSGGAPGDVAVVGLRQSLNVFSDSFTQSMAANANATSRKYDMEAAAIKTWDNAVMLVQQQETDLTNDQIIVLIDLFQMSTPHSTTYLNIQRESLWKTWLAAQLKWAGHI